jgi:carbamoyl-phosphate synthase large subunit
VLIDCFLEDATEVDVDALRDATGEVVIGGVMEHVEEAGVHSGDSACAIPPPTLQPWVIEVIEHYATSIAHALDVKGLINIQFAVRGNQVNVIEANPRASRTVPFVAKATGVPLAKIAARIILGATLQQLREEGLLKPPVTGHTSVKEAVLPFNRFPEVDPALGPEMRSTGEVMGIDTTFGLAFAKSQAASYAPLPSQGSLFLSLKDRDKPAGIIVAKRFRERGLKIIATKGTAAYLARFGFEVDRTLSKLSDNEGVSALDLIASGEITFVVNTPTGRGGRTDGSHIRTAAVVHRVSCVTTVEAALAAAQGMAEAARNPLSVRSLQEFHGL